MNTVSLHGNASDGLWQMLGLSSVAHAGLLVALALMPGLLGGRASSEDRDVMVITLGGAPGPRAGGMTSMGGQAVQQAVPATPRVREPARPPAAQTPEMTVPTKTERPRPRREQLKPAPDEATATTPNRAPREQLGSAIAQTGGSGIGLGLSTGSGGTGGEIRVGDFCCPEYLSTMLQLIQRGWNQKQPVGGITTMRFTIQRSGAITNVEVARSSGYVALDLAAQRALTLAQLPPLPVAYTNPELTINLYFEYLR